MGCGVGGAGGPFGDRPGDDADGDDSGDTDSGTPVEPEIVVTACPDGSGDHTTVQAAVDAAPDDAVVQLCGQSFAETVVVDGRSLTIRGEDGAVLDGGREERVLEVTATTGATNVRLEGVTLTRGWSSLGGALWCEDATLSMQNVVITANEAEEGGGFGATLGSPHAAQAIPAAAGQSETVFDIARLLGDELPKQSERLGMIFPGIGRAFGRWRGRLIERGWRPTSGQGRRPAR
ncbi:MAG: hypothetical protein ACK4YP_11475, partial [Myxococcota bacterium]